MPWEVTICRNDKAPLGDLAAVRSKIVAALPAIEFRMEPSGPEQIATLRERGIEIPDIIRAHLEQMPARLLAGFEKDNLYVELKGFDTTPLTQLHVEVRGSGNSTVVLKALCVANDWIAIDDASGQPIDLAAQTIAEWGGFQKYRDRAIDQIRRSERDGRG